MKNNFSRRDFIKLMLASLGAAFLAACERAAKPVATILPTLTPAPSETETPQPTSTDVPRPTATETQTPTPTEIPCFRLLTPENGAKLKALGKVTFAWEAMLGAVKYRLEIILPSGQSVSFETDASSRDQYLEAFRLGGKYQWKVTALEASGAIICTVSPFTFEKPEYVPPTRKSGSNGSDGQGESPTDSGGDTSSGGPGSGGVGAGGAGAN